MQTQPLLIIGTQRSGSNLLRLMLNESSDIAAPHPPHILKTFFPLLPLYGDLEQEANFQQLVADVCTFVQKNPVEWEVQPFFEQLYPRCMRKSLVEVMRVVYARVAEAKGARYWCCKSMANVEFLDKIQAELPEAKYIYLYRDGRDVAVSFAKAVVGEKHFYAIARQWADDQKRALDFQKKCPSGQFFMLPYEKLIGNPVALLQELCAFLGVSYEEQMMQYYESKESKRTADSGEMWKNVVKPVLADNRQKFLREASGEQIRIFEAVAGDYLQALGYELHTPVADRHALREEEIAGYEAENQRLKQAIRSQIKAEDLAKRKPQEDLLLEIKNR